MTRRIAAVVVIAVGLAFVISTFAYQGFRRAHDGEQLMDEVRPALTADGTRFRDDLERYRRGTAELFETTLPTLAPSLTFFSGSVRADVAPAVAEWEAKTDEIADFTNGIVTNIERHRDDFAAADAIPTKSLPLDITPFVMIGVGLALVACGVWALRAASSAPLIAAAAIGVALIVVPLATSFPSKSRNVDDLLDSLRFSPEVATATRARFDVVRAGHDELEARVLPTIASSRGITAAQLDELIASDYPAVSELRRELPEIIVRFDAGASIREDYIDDLNGLKSLPITAFPVLLVAAGVLITIVSAAALVFGRRGADRRESAAAALP